MPLIVYLVGENFEKYISMIAPWVAFALLSLIGGNMIREALSPEEEVSLGFDMHQGIIVEADRKEKSERAPESCHSGWLS